MSIPFVGDGHRKLVDQLTAEFERVCADRTPSWWSLEGNTGWGKTRVIQEFYARIASSQPEPPYWPPSILTVADERVSVTRKRVHPPLTKPAAGASPAWFWWGISCSSRHGLSLDALVHDLARFEERREAIERRYRDLAPSRRLARRAVDRRKGEIAEAALGDAIGAVAATASVMIPGLSLLLLVSKWGIGHARVEYQRRTAEDTEIDNSTDHGLVDEVAPALEQFAAAGIPLLIVIEDIHEADEALTELVARVLAAESAPILVLTTSWRGMIDQPHRPAQRLLERVAQDRQHRILCEREVAGLTAVDLEAIVGAVLPDVDATSRERLARRFPNPYSLQLACQTRAVRRSALQGSIAEDLVASLPRDIDALFTHLWAELPEPLRRALVVASQLAPGSISAQLGFGDLRWDPELVSTAVGRVEWLATELPELTESMRDARDAYAWIRTVDQWLQRFHDPAQYQIAVSALDDEYAPQEQIEIRAAGADAVGTLSELTIESGDERAVNRNRLLVALASEGLVPWNQNAVKAAIRICRGAHELGGSAELQIALEICQRALRNPACEREQELVLSAYYAACLGAAGRVREAVEAFETAVADQARELGADSTETLNTRRELAGWIGRAGRVNEAVAQLRQLLVDCTRGLGAEALNTLQTRSSLAAWLAEQGHRADAAEQYEAVLEAQIRVCGRDSREVLVTRNNIAALLGERGQVNEAIEQYEHLLRDRVRLLGSDAPDTLVTRNNLAHWLAAAGRLPEAIEQYQALVSDHVRTLGPDAPATLRTRNNLASVLAEQGQLTEAIRRYEQLVADGTRVLGPDSPLVLTIRHNLAGRLSEHGENTDAIERLEALVRDRTRVLGSDASDTLATSAELATCLAKAGRVDDAVDRLGEVLNAQIHLLRPDDPLTLVVRDNLAYWLAEAGQIDTAIAQYEQLLEAKIRVYGRDASTTWGTRQDLGRVLATIGRLDAAIEQYTRAVAAQTRALGHDHRQTLVTRSNLAYWLVRAGQIDAAIDEYEVVVVDMARTLGATDPGTVVTRINLAGWLGASGRLEDAIHHLDQLVKEQTRALGADAPETLTTRKHLAHWVGASGRRAEAARQYEDLLNDVTRILGADGPLAGSVRTELAALQPDAHP